MSSISNYGMNNFCQYPPMLQGGSYNQPQYGLPQQQGQGRCGGGHRRHHGHHHRHHGQQMGGYGQNFGAANPYQFQGFSPLQSDASSLYGNVSAQPYGLQSNATQGFDPSALLASLYGGVQQPQSYTAIQGLDPMSFLSSILGSGAQQLQGYSANTQGTDLTALLNSLLGGQQGQQYALPNLLQNTNANNTYFLG